MTFPDPSCQAMCGLVGDVRCLSAFGAGYTWIHIPYVQVIGTSSGPPGRAIQLQVYLSTTSLNGLAPSGGQYMI